MDWNAYAHQLAGNSPDHSTKVGAVIVGPRAPYWKGLAIPFRDGMTFDMYTGEVLA